MGEQEKINKKKHKTHFDPRAVELKDHFFNFFDIPDYIPHKWIHHLLHHFSAYFVLRDKCDKEQANKDRDMNELTVKPWLEEIDRGIANAKKQTQRLIERQQEMADAINNMVSEGNSFADILQKILDDQESFDWYDGNISIPTPSTRVDPVPDPDAPSSGGGEEPEPSPTDEYFSFIVSGTNCNISVNGYYDESTHKVACGAGLGVTVTAKDGYYITGAYTVIFDENGNEVTRNTYTVANPDEWVIAFTSYECKDGYTVMFYASASVSDINVNYETSELFNTAII